jgi:5-formyltetrahydrofolate cyclo-ligase
MDDTGRPTKAALRALALARRDALGEAARRLGSDAIAKGALPILEAAAPRVLAAYRAYGSEADPSPLMAPREPWDVALPAMVDGQQVVFRRYRQGDALIPDAMRIAAPAESADLLEPDVWLVPVSAFDRSGTRLGKGRGVYDRAIAGFRARGLNPLLVGIAFSVQEVPPIPAERHDVRLDWLVTENEVLRFF